MKLQHSEDQLLKHHNTSVFPPECFQQALSWFQDLLIQWLDILRQVYMNYPLSMPSDMTVSRKKENKCFKTL